MDFSEQDIDLKFAILLQPIKDLAKNFSIDLNQCLDEYLNQIDTAQVKMPNGFQSINFIEAALILRGSAVVYSKKVDYVFDLALSILETLHGSKITNIKSCSTNQLIEKNPSFSSNIRLFPLLDFDLSTNLNCKEDVSKVTLTVMMPLSLESPNLADDLVHSQGITDHFDKICFAMNNCKIFESIVILDHCDMLPLVDSVHGIRIEKQMEAGYTDDTDIYDNSYYNLLGDEAEVKFSTDLNFENSASEAFKGDKLLDPHGHENKMLLKSAKEGRTFMFPQKHLPHKRSSVKFTLHSFLHKYHDVTDGRRQMNIEKELDNMFSNKRIIIKSSTKQDHLEALSSAQDFELPNEDMFSPPCEDLITQCMVEFFKSSENYMVMSELTRKVTEWGEMLLPVLQEEEKNAPYDIHKYNVEALFRIDKCGGLDKHIPFVEVVINDNCVEVCRIFMSILHLVNQGIIEVKDSSSESCSLHIKLLRRGDYSNSHKCIFVP